MAYLYKISRIRFKKSTLINGTILCGDPKKSPSEGFRSIISSYANTPFKNRLIKIECGSEKLETRTNSTGAFQISVGHDLNGDLFVFDDNNNDIPAGQTYPIDFQESTFKLSVISDLDDTVLISHTRNILKRIGTILFIHPLKRIAIGFTKNLLNEVSKLGGDVYFVSKSETNLFGLLSTFLQHNNLPNGSVFLTNHLKLSQLLHPKKGRKFKQETIETIINSTTGKQFILIGDDTQNDIDVYSSIVRKYPKSIFKVYIRKTLKNKLKSQQHQLLAIEELNVPFLFFDDNQNLKKELESIHQTFES